MSTTNLNIKQQEASDRLVKELVNHFSEILVSIRLYDIATNTEEYSVPLFRIVCTIKGDDSAAEDIEDAIYDTIGAIEEDMDVMLPTFVVSDYRFQAGLFDCTGMPEMRGGGVIQYAKQ